MVKPEVVGFGEWNEMVAVFHEESDRGAAVLAGSFAEHALGTYLMHRVTEKHIGEKLFGPVGPLSSFSQRIAVAYAFGFISSDEYREFEIVRQVRNHFAHHPMESSFESSAVQRYTANLRMFKEQGIGPFANEREHHRIAYLLACGLLSGRLMQIIEKDSQQSNPRRKQDEA